MFNYKFSTSMKDFEEKYLKEVDEKLEKISNIAQAVDRTTLFMAGLSLGNPQMAPITVDELASVREVLVESFETLQKEKSDFLIQLSNTKKEEEKEANAVEVPEIAQRKTKVKK